MDTRYRDNGYTSELYEPPQGAFLTVLRHGKIVGEIAVVYGSGKQKQAQVAIKHFAKGELPLGSIVVDPTE